MYRLTPNGLEELMGAHYQIPHTERECLIVGVTNSPPPLIWCLSTELCTTPLYSNNHLVVTSLYNVYTLLWENEVKIYSHCMHVWGEDMLTQHKHK